MSFTSGQVLTAAQLNDLDIDSLTLTDASPALTLKDTNSTGTSNFEIKFTDSANTNLARIYGGGGNDIRFEVAGSNHTIMSDSGRLGVGTFGPETMLHVVTTNKLGSTFTGTTDGEGLRVDQSNYTADNFVSLVEASYDDGQTEPHVRMGAQFTSSGSKLAFGTSNSYGSGITNQALTIDASGQVGIGTSTPETLLHVNAGNVNLGLLVESTDTAAIIGLKDNTTSGNSYVGIRADGDDLKLRAGNANRVTVTSAGVLQWVVSSGVGGPLTDTSSTSGYRYVLQNQTFGTFFDYTSVRDRKDQITNVTAEDSGRWIDALQPVTYIERWMGEGDEPDDARTWREADMQVGFIADDILANADTDHFSQVLDDGEGGLDPAGWKWECVIAAAVAEIKSLRARVATLEA